MLSPLPVLIVSLASFAAAQNPDRAPLADEWGYRPAENGTAAVNPPALSWVLEKDAISYAVEWANDSNFKKPVSIGELPWTVYTHNAPFTPGKYFWHYRLAGGSRWAHEFQGQLRSRQADASSGAPGRAAMDH